MKCSKMTLSAAVVSLLMSSSTVFAADTFKEDHPRRAEVNQREKKQDKRIAEGLKSGKLTQAQANQLQGEEAGVKAQEKAEVKANGGYLTKPEQKQLNQELNQDSKQIHSEKNPTSN